LEVKKKWHHYKKWEEYHAGMWRKVTKSEREEYLEKAIDFTGNAELYGEYMIEVVLNWEYSCEQNLTDMSLNRKAWIGHAACCMAIRCPEYITRSAWWHLTKDQRDRANLNASIAIELWEEQHIKGQYE
jgi:hypothetical protein